ncbi:MAG: hypothetical protein MR762_04515, partial [Clostridiales bacterium]|nr:hypothetical protein [Clostridiales bacterium]
MKIRLTALILAASLTVNMVTLPVKAEEDTTPVEQQTTITEPSSGAGTVSGTEQSAAEPVESQPASSESTDQEPEPAETTAPVTEPTKSATEPAEPKESTDQETEQLLIGQPNSLQTNDTLLLEPEEAALPALMALDAGTGTGELTPSKIKQENPINAYPNNTRITINDANELAILSTISADIYQYCELYFVNSSSAFDTTNTAFNGLGKEKPFSGTVTLAQATTNPIKLNVPLFQNLSDSAKIPDLILQYAKEGDNGHTAILAENVKHEETSVEGNVDWMITLQKPDDEGEMADIVSTCLIGTIDEGCNISLSVTDNIGKPVIGSSSAGFLCSTLNGSLTMKGLDRTNPISVTAKSGNAGGLVGEMGGNASLTVTLDKGTVDSNAKPATLQIAAVSATKNAGGLVGKMAAGATLTINTDVNISGSVQTSVGDAGGLVGLAKNTADDTPKTVTIKAMTDENTPSELTLSGTISSDGTDSSKGNVGGLIGKATDIIFAGGLPTVNAQNATITGSNAGGLIGSYTYSGVSDVLDSVSQSISGITVSGSSNAGGVFGVLNIGGNAEFTISSASVSTKLTAGTTSCNGGGLIGKYTAGDLDAKLSLSAPVVSTTPSGTFSALGGLIGLVGDQDNGTYIEIGTTEQSTITVTTSGASATDFGGLIAKLTNSGHMVKTVGAVKVINSLPGSSTCGGLVGYMPSGVLWMGGSVDVNDVTTGGNILQNRGWILGSRDNTLVFTDQSDWNYAKGSNTNDIGNWGQVLSIPKICTNSTDLLTVADHKVTVVAATSEANTYSIGTPLDFAKIALGLQLTGKGALGVTSIIGDLDITLTSDIDLSGTGLTGFQRDADVGNNKITACGVTLYGNNHTITLPGIKTYVNDTSHQYQGLFSKVTDLTADNLTISGGASCTEGETAINNVGIQLECNGDFYVGGLAADASGNIALTSVTAGASIITNNGRNAAIGGLVGRRSFTGNSQTPGALTCTGCTWAAGSNIRVSGNNSGIYVGGLIGRVDNGSSQKSMKITFKDCTISGTLSRTGSPADARIGGMLGACYGKDAEFTLLIDGVMVDGTTVTSDATSEMGGLLSLEWLDTNVTLKNVVVKNNSKVESTGSSSFGGLVFKAMGYCKIGEAVTDENGTTTTTPGVTIESGTFSGPSPKGEPSALLICHGEERGVLKNALYLEILDGAYKIVPDGITLALKNGSTTFDEIIGTTFGDVGKGNGIVSIATNNGLVDAIRQEDGTVVASTRNTYQNATKNSGAEWNNPNTRYYYNLDSFGAARDGEVPSGNITSPEKMVMYSAFSHADDSIQKYFYTSLGHITGIIDLTGYSYYPAEEYTNISDADIKFAFEEINGKETDNKTLDDSNKQHAGMHTGIFTGVSGGGTVNVGNLTLQGTVGGLGNNFGALIRDNAQGGSDTSHMADLKINGVTLDGLMMVGTSETGVKPLLIHSLGSFTSLTMSTVTTTAAYANMTETDGQYAASSLIGPVGSDTASYIQLEFKDMRLDGRINADSTQTKVHETYRSIFSKATFLESFQYGNASTCRGVYNFNKSTDDVPSYYTLGKELSNTTSGRNQGLQYWFFDTDDYVCGSEADADTAYATGYLPYVCHSEEDKWHELDVNLKSTGLTVGCGTYTDPYIITDGQQLVDLSKALAEGGLKENWEINLDENVLGRTFSLEGSKDENGKHTCKKYTGSATGWRKDDETVDNKTATATNVLAYLRNAYYKIEQDITISSNTWAGLGITSDKNDKAFSGVFYGNPTHPNGNVTITIENPSQETQFGGLIKFSLGSVIKDVNIVYQTQPQVNTYVENGATNIPSTTTNASFFGGVVGWCIGGDTIIDNVTVTYQNGEPAVSGNNGHLTAVGGYVGMVGGAINDAGDSSREKYGGGVVFRGDIGGGLGGKSDNYFYYNPYVGRVLDGYVLSEKTKLDNTDDNYQIPTITADKHLNIADGAVTVNNAQGLWLLSAIANSGAGAMQNSNCLAYYVGKPRTGTYANVGGSMSDDDKTDEGLLGGVGGKGKERTTCYLTKYVSGDFSNLCSSGVSIVLNSDCDMSTFGNGFRGIGSSYGTDADNSSNYRLIPVVSLSSAEEPKKTVTLQQSRKEYLEEMGNWTSIGSGLFVQLDGPSSGVQVSNLILSGSTSIQYYSGTELTGENPTGNHDEFSTRIAKVGSGMLAGGLFPYSDAGSITIENVELSNATVNSSETVTKNNVTRICTGSTNAGGLIGVIRNTRTKKNPNNQDVPCLESVTLKNCGYTGLNVTGRLNVGGFIGYVRAVKTVKVNNADTNIAVAVNILYSANKTLTNGVITSTRFKAEKEYGCGGLIGFSSDANLSIMPDSTSSDARLTLKNLTVHGNAGDGSGDRANVGGVVGYWKAQRVPVEAKNISLEGEVSIAGSENSSSKAAVGGFAGSLADNLTSWTSSTTAGVTIENFWIAQESDSNAKIYNGRPIGGLIGTMKAGNSIQVSGIKIGSDHGANDITGAVTVANNVNSNDYSHSVGGLLGSNHNVSTTITFEDIQMVHTTIIACTTSSDFRGAGIVFSHLENNLTVNLKNVLLDRCNVIGNKSDMKIGLLYSQLHKDRSNVLYGSNILIKDCVVGYSTADTCNTTGGTCPTAPASVSYDGTKMGIIGGESNGKTVKLVGVSIQQTDNTLPMKDFGTNPGTGSYVVRADYKGYQDGTIAGAKAPYVTTSPRSPLNIPDKTITGDGASFVTGGTTPVGKQILDDLTPKKNAEGEDIPLTNLNLKHSAANAYDDSKNRKAYEYLSAYTDKTKFGPFSTEGGNGDNYTGLDFPVLTLVTNSSTEANSLLYSWISLLANRDITPDTPDVTIKATNYRWNGTNKKWESYTTDSSKDKSFDWIENKIQLNKGTYDSAQNRFTLLDVAFKDPANDSQDAYYLYIPVVMQKIMKFHFWASAQTGTSYIKSTYDNLSALAAASHGEQVTVLLGYDYFERDEDKWQETINNGDNLLFGFEKTLLLDQNQGLPNGTRLTLVDCSQQNRAYYATKDNTWQGENAYKVDFTNFKDSDGKPWAPLQLWEMLDLQAEKGSGKYYTKQKDNEKATLKATLDGSPTEFWYYSGDDGDTAPPGEDAYTIAIGENAKWFHDVKSNTDYLAERYYLTIQTPTDADGVYNNLIKCPSSLGASGLPTLRVKNPPVNEY